jgi:hypothetical protein
VKWWIERFSVTGRAEDGQESRCFSYAMLVFMMIKFAKNLVLRSPSQINSLLSVCSCCLFTVDRVGYEGNQDSLNRSIIHSHSATGPAEVCGTSTDFSGHMKKEMTCVPA